MAPLLAVGAVAWLSSVWITLDLANTLESQSRTATTFNEFFQLLFRPQLWLMPVWLIASAGFVVLALWTYGTVILVRAHPDDGPSPALAAWGWVLYYLNFVWPVLTVRWLSRRLDGRQSTTHLRAAGMVWWVTWVAAQGGTFLGFIVLTIVTSPFPDRFPDAVTEVEMLAFFLDYTARFVRFSAVFSALLAVWSAIGVFYVSRVERALAASESHAYVR